MAWSTRELAELAGTTLNTVRYYHRQGLLDEPARSANGYKQYGIAHLVRLLQIRRLRDIGVPISKIWRTKSGVETSPDVLADIDAELADTIERDQRTRVEIADLLEHGPITAVPAGFARVASRLSPSERSLMLIYEQLFTPDAIDDIRAMAEAAADAATLEFESLSEDADKVTRARLAEELAATLTESLRNYPWLREQRTKLQQTPYSTAVAMGEAMNALLNPAQRDVLRRAHDLAKERLREEGAPDTPK